MLERKHIEAIEALWFQERPSTGAGWSSDMAAAVRIEALIEEIERAEAASADVEVPA